MSDPLARNNVTLAGADGAPATMVFVHGFGTDQGAWAQVAAAFADDYREVLLDNIGAGHSDPAAFVQSRYLELPAYARDLIEVCDAAGVSETILVGHSVGGMIGLIAAVERPELFSRLVLIGASPCYRNGEGYHGGFTREDIDATYSAAMDDFEGWAEQFAPLMMGNAERPSLGRYFAASLKAVRRDRALTTLYAIFHSDHRDLVTRVTQPTLVMQSRNDAAVPREVADYLHAHLPHSELNVIDADGHLRHISAPDAVIASMRAFLGRPTAA